jgi:hypothetical protein
MAAPAAAIVVSESGATGETKKAAQTACVKMETEASVLIRLLIATPAQGRSRS